jgi:SAM-dependent methyltransferase
MPTSDPRQLGPIVQELVRLAPASVLDVGAGYGKYGPLIREYVDDYQWKTRIEAVEPFDDYLERSCAFKAYDYVHECTLGELIRMINGKTAPTRLFDVALLVDVIEHFPKPDGEGVLLSLYPFVRYMIVATPREPSDQGTPPPYGNHYETHRSRWREADFARDWLPTIDRFVPIPGDDQIVVTLEGAHA